MLLRYFTHTQRRQGFWTHFHSNRFISPQTRWRVGVVGGGGGRWGPSLGGNKPSRMKVCQNPCRLCVLEGSARFAIASLLIASGREKNNYCSKSKFCRNIVYVSSIAKDFSFHFLHVLPNLVASRVKRG